MTWIILLAIIFYVIIGILVYKYEMYDRETLFERIYMSSIWILLVPLYIFGYLYGLLGNLYDKMKNKQ